MRSSLQLLLWSTCILLVSTLTAIAGESGRGRNERIFVVPAPAAVKIDGDLTDWDKSGGIFTFVTPETQAMQSLRTYAMYDAQAFYLGAEVKDITPMMNAHDPDINPGFAWDADAFQFRFFLKPRFPGIDNAPAEEIVHLLLWYFAGKQQPNLQLSYGMRYEMPKKPWKAGVVPADLYQAVFKKSADGKGYTFEYRIPWTTMSERYRPKAGDLTAATFQCHWGTPDGMKTLGIAGWAYDLMSGPGFPFQGTYCWGKAIFSEKGNLPKELTQEGLEPLPPAPLEFRYHLPKDGVATVALLDARGAPVRHIVAAQKRGAGDVVESWDGLDDKGDPLPPGTYKWKGLLHDELKVQWKLSVHNSGKPGYPMPDGKGSWGADHGDPTCAATAGDRVFLGWNVGECGWAIIGTDLDGKKQWGGRWQCLKMAADGQYVYFLGGMAEIGIMRVNAATGQQVKFGNNDQFVILPEGIDAKRISGLALIGNKLYAAYPRDEGQPESINRIIEIDKGQGTVLRDLPLTKFAMKNEEAAPAGLDKTPLEDIAAGGPNSLYATIDGMLVSISMDGACVILAADHLDKPHGIAVDADGNIYVANRGKLQNIAAFDKDGTFIRFIGKPGGRPAIGMWNGNGVLNPAGMTVDKRGRLWVAEENHTPKRQSVWDTKTGKLVADYFGGSAYSTYVSMDPNDPSRVYCHGVQWKVDLDKGTWAPEAIVSPDYGMDYFTVFTGPNGKQYAYTRGDSLLIREGDSFALAGGFCDLDAFANEPWYEDFKTQRKAKNLGTRLFWSDNNGDRAATPDELADPPFPLPYWGGSVDTALSLYGCTQNGPFGYRLKAVKVLSNGVPVYDVAKIERFGQEGAGYSNHIIGDPKDGSVYLLGGGIYGEKKNPGLNAYTALGTPRWGSWTVATDWNVALNNGTPPKGTAWGMTRWMGKAGNYLAGLNYFGTIDLWTVDGLYVDKIYQDQRLGASGPDVINAEFFCGQFVKVMKTGRYFLLAGDCDGRVNELIGLSSMQYLQGTYVIAPADYERAAKERLAFQAAKTRAQAPTLHRLAGLDWGKARMVKKRIDENRQFKVGLAYNEQYLVLRYEVQSPFELTNAVTDPQVLFKGGNCLDVEIQTDLAADPKRAAAGEGDVRLIITRQQGKPVCIGYFKKVNGFDGKPLTLVSPTGSETFDKIEAISIEMDYAKTPSGFNTVVRIPQTALGLALKPASTVRLDVGYRFGNVYGTQSALRAYWSNSSPLSGIIYDIPSEVRMEPANWGTVTVE